MTFQTELDSWKSPATVPVADPPVVNAPAPQTDRLSFPRADGKPVLVTFLRHCGCPFAEKTFQLLRDVANAHKDVAVIAISHSSQEATDKWLVAVGGQWDVEVIVDTERMLYAQYGLGVSSAWHVLNPLSLYSVYTMGKKEGIWNRPTESGSRWQTSGTFAVDKEGILRWERIATSADDIPDVEAALAAIGVEMRKRRSRM